MAKEDRSLIQLSRIFDIVLTVLTFLLAYLIKNSFLPPPFRGLCYTANYYLILLLIGIIWYTGFQYSSLYTLYFRKRPLTSLFMRVTEVVTINMLFLALFFYIFKIEDISRLMIGIFYIGNIIVLTASRWGIHKILRFLRTRKNLLLNVLVVVGSKQAAKDLISAIQRDADANLKILGCLDLECDAIGTEVADGVKVIGTLEQLGDILASHVVDEVIFAMPVDMIWNAEKYFNMAEAVGVQIRVVPHWHLRRFLVSRPHFYSMDFEEFLETPTFVLSATPQNRGELMVKAAFDTIFAILLLIVFSPLFLIIACAIKFFSPGPVFFKQVRSGLNGRRFTLYKFRSMVVDAEVMLGDLLELNEASGPVFKMKDDPRIIPRIGTFLRKTSLDELPQLINVARGEMSLIGPRPPIPEEVAKYQLWERRRLSMKPGITCLWQILPQRNEVSFQKWMELDLQYIDNWSLWLDFTILCKTALAVVLGRGR